MPQAPFSNDEQEELDQTAEAVEEVELDGMDFIPNINKMKTAFLLYGKYQTAFAYTQNIKLTQYIDSTYRPFYVDKQKKRIDTFSDELRKVAKKNGFRISRVKSRKTVDKIKIRFLKNNPLKIKAIFVKKRGCQYERLSGIDKLKQTDKTTSNYIVNLEKMIKDLSFQGQDVPWLDFMTEYTYPALEINFGDIDNNEEPLNSCIDQESVENLKDNVLKGLMSFSEVIQFSLSTNSCKTLEDIANNNDYNIQRINLKESLKKKKQKRKQRRQERKTTREEKQQLEETVNILEEAILQGPNQQELQQIIQELQQNKAKLFLNSSKELDTIESLKTEKKINKSIISKLQERVTILNDKLEQDSNSPEFTPISGELTSLESEIEQLESKNLKTLMSNCKI